ncbi:MAG TPA: hypothetical protein PK609_00255 [Candidatus Paceibacterota bacterium]|nr:hypothetical protein [Candidatus Paceibacterota bacterium]
MKIFQVIADKYKESKQRSLNKKEFEMSLVEAAADGVLDDKEVEELKKRQSDLGLTDEETKRAKIGAYQTALVSAKSDGQITKEEEEELIRIQKHLGISDVEIAQNKKELARLRLLNEIQLGNIPEVFVPNLITEKDEKVYWAEPAQLIEEKVIKRRYEGGSQGVSLRIAKGVSYRVGGSRGHLVSETGLVPVGTGELVITNKRVVFRGDGKTFSIKLNKLLDVQVLSNGVYFSEINKAKQKMVKYTQPGNQDIIGAILSYAINNFKSK